MSDQLDREVIAEVQEASESIQIAASEADVLNVLRGKTQAAGRIQ